MVIEFPITVLGAAPSTEGASAEDGAAFASLVEGLLADPAANPDVVEGSLEDASGPLPEDPAASLFVFAVPGAFVPGTGPQEAWDLIGGDSASRVEGLVLRGENTPEAARHSLDDPSAPPPGDQAAWVLVLPVPGGPVPGTDPQAMGDPVDRAGGSGVDGPGPEPAAVTERVGTSLDHAHEPPPGDQSASPFVSAGPGVPVLGTDPDGVGEAVGRDRAASTLRVEGRVQVAEPATAPAGAGNRPDDPSAPPPADQAASPVVSAPGVLVAGIDPLGPKASIDRDRAASEAAVGPPDKASAAPAVGAHPNPAKAGDHQEPSTPARVKANASTSGPAGAAASSDASTPGPDSQWTASAPEVTGHAPDAPTPPVGASNPKRALRTEARQAFERAMTSTTDAAPIDMDAVRRVAAFVESGPDSGSTGREGSRDGGSPGAGSSPVPVLTGPAAAYSALASPQVKLVPAARPDDVVLPQLVRGMRLQLVGGVGEARIQLDPQHLGAVTVHLRVEGGVVSAAVIAEQPAVRQWIEQHEMSLRQALAEQGLLLDRLHVERDERSPEKRPSHRQDGLPRRRAPRKETATFELLV